MGIASDVRDFLANGKANSILISSPADDCIQDGVRSGVKAACIACVASAVPTLVAVRKIPWAKANLNYTGQALVISSATIAAFFVTVDKAILRAAKKNSKQALIDKAT